jgi:hypothetical protein
MFETNMVEAGEGVLASKDMTGEPMEQLLKHIYTGSTDNFKNLKVDVVLQLLNASVKVKYELKIISSVKCPQELEHSQSETYLCDLL